jgi:hypothetical protein
LDPSLLPRYFSSTIFSTDLQSKVVQNLLTGYSTDVRKPDFGNFQGGWFVPQPKLQSKLLSLQILRFRQDFSVASKALFSGFNFNAFNVLTFSTFVASWPL